MAGRRTGEGDLKLPAGTVIALFDPDGHYGNHTDGTCHAAIYMGQDSTGLRVIDQWIERRDEQIDKIHPPQNRIIHFRNSNGLPVNQGEGYRVVQ